MMNIHSIGGHRGFEGWWGMYVLEGAHYTYFRIAVTGDETKIMVLLSQRYLSFTGDELYDRLQRRICCRFSQIWEHKVPWQYPSEFLAKFPY